jgi:hypothetical protein
MDGTVFSKEDVMLYILLIIPWALTVALLSYIIVKDNNKGSEEDYDDLSIEDDENHHIIRAAIYDSKAFWVHDNIFYESDVIREPDWSTAKPIDTMKLSQKSLSNLLKILDDLKEDEKEDR